MNLKKTKVVFAALSQGLNFRSEKHTFEVCFNDFGVNPLCILCNHWVHKRCKDLKRKLASSINFKYRKCLGSQDIECKVVEHQGKKGVD